jgi:predicted  nucleic acid-binding Zn-ribbon protein
LNNGEFYLLKCGALECGRNSFIFVRKESKARKDGLRSKQVKILAIDCRLRILLKTVLII